MQWEGMICQSYHHVMSQLAIRIISTYHIQDRSDDPDISFHYRHWRLWKGELGMHDVHELGIKGSECHGSGQNMRIR